MNSFRRHQTNEEGNVTTAAATEVDLAAVDLADPAAAVDAHADALGHDGRRAVGLGPVGEGELALDRLALDVEVRQHTVEPAGHPPRLVAEQGHDGGNERHAHDERVDGDADGEAERDRFDRRVAFGHERREHGEHDDGGGGDDPRRGREPAAHRRRRLRHSPARPATCR